MHEKNAWQYVMLWSFHQAVPSRWWGSCLSPSFQVCPGVCAVDWCLMHLRSQRTLFWHILPVHLGLTEPSEAYSSILTVGKLKLALSVIHLRPQAGSSSLSSIFMTQSVVMWWWHIHQQNKTNIQNDEETLFIHLYIAFSLTVEVYCMGDEMCDTSYTKQEYIKCLKFSKLKKINFICHLFYMTSER